MKHRWLSILGIALLVVFAACKRNEVSNTASTDTSTTPASMTDTSTDTPSTQAAGTGTSSTSMAAATTDSAGSTLDQADQQFVTKAAEGGISEVTLGQLAAAKAKSADVRAFGNQMVSDHGKANSELTELARLKGVTLPTTPGKEDEKLANTLSSKDGKTFDRTYMENMVRDHEKDVREFERASRTAADPGVKAWAANTLPTLKDHLRMARETLARVRV